MEICHLKTDSVFYFVISGWHRRINGKAGRTELSFYVLVPLLLAEADTVTVQMRLISENLLTKIHRQIYKKNPWPFI